VTERQRRSPNELDDRVREIVQTALEPYDDDVASVRWLWSEPARMWFVEVTPAGDGSAWLSVGVDDDLLSVTVADTWFELFPVNDTALDEFAAIVEAIFAGRVVEAGSRSCAFARITTRRGVIHVGHVHLPLPWRWRRTRHYLPYG
jgi:hypothetical protein